MAPQAIEASKSPLLSPTLQPHCLSVSNLTFHRLWQKARAHDNPARSIQCAVINILQLSQFLIHKYLYNYFRLDLFSRFPTLQLLVLNITRCKYEDQFDQLLKNPKRLAAEARPLWRWHPAESPGWKWASPNLTPRPPYLIRHDEYPKTPSYHHGFAADIFS